MSFSDPIRENAATAIEKCRLAGVKVKLFLKSKSHMTLFLFHYRLF